jgi:myo-inositol-1(or 4)-monophosphatase
VIEGDPTKPRFIIDPLDGTTNFLHGIPHFAISIAVQEPKLDGSGWGEVTAGLVYQPVTDESFWAEKARGAWLHDRRLRVSSRRHLDESLIATGIPFAGHGDTREWQKIYAALGRRWRASAALRGRAGSGLGGGGPLRGLLERT